ncbi:MAG TPA: hypothetical protein VK658_21905 [Chryseolinea sp.]|nr:hypothetical protein [Chryseolinea sp.]
MDFRAVKIILATFLLIAFVTPFFRLSVALPKKGKDENVTYVKPVRAGNLTFEPGSLALARRGVPSDSTATN